jgi:hypothetical protein
MTPDGVPDLSAADRQLRRDDADNSADVPSKPSDPLGVLAIILGCIGIVTFGFVLAIVTAVVATAAGQQASRQRRSLDNAYIAFGLAAVDAVVFLVLHYVFDLPAFAG